MKKTSNEKDNMIEKVAKPKKTNYLNNKDMLEELLKSKKEGKMTNNLSNMIIKLTDRYSLHPWFSKYSYLQDMKGFAHLTVVKFWNRFDETKSKNAFAYFTQIIKRAFYQYNIQEKKHRNIRDLLLVEHGENPSFTFANEYDSDNYHFEKMDNYEKDEQFKLFEKELTKLDSEENSKEVQTENESITDTNSTEDNEITDEIDGMIRDE